MVTSEQPEKTEKALIERQGVLAVLENKIQSLIVFSVRFPDCSNESMSSRFSTIVFMSVFLNLSRHMAQATTSRFLQTTTAFISSPRTLKREQYFHELSHRQNIGLHADKNSNDNEKDFEPTWTYVPYDPSKPKIRKSHHQQQQRRFSSWNVPKTVDIPEDRLDISFVRSSGVSRFRLTYFCCLKMLCWCS